MAKCKVCGAPHKACGPATTVTPVDTNITQGGQTVGLRRYDVTIEGRRQHTTTLLLSDEDAKRMGVFEEKPKARTVTNKARTPQNKTTKSKRGVESASNPDATEA